MKRTGSINLERMRKQRLRPLLKPLIAAMAGATLAGCGESEEVRIFSTLAECTQALPDQVQLCETAYKQALEESRKTSPKYRNRLECELEFGEENCEAYRTESGQRWFMPAMAGFMVGQALNRERRDHYLYGNPLYRPSGFYSATRGKWVASNGKVIGDGFSKHARVDSDVFKPRPAVTSTISRGGFGSTSVAKSSWGSSGSRSSWGS